MIRYKYDTPVLTDNDALVEHTKHVAEHHHLAEVDVDRQRGQHATHERQLSVVRVVELARRGRQGARLGGK